MSKKVKEVVTILEDNGWTMVRQRGSHRVYRHPENPHVVAVSGRWNETLPVGTLSGIRRLTGLNELR